eukprot:gnl/Dysnectes_brevis/1533_a1741_1464.p1 GENE.gnl/Dysnectes_brevis/1533_a1741_1464~~gnl/Dysnectes_brevis/1533_a1741_1464.p1  ORF type:complete len:318 (+),score=104.02 gnl/Dysnectes_brevis/1533_a1741_1464:858-1811(+)
MSVTSDTTGAISAVEINTECRTTEHSIKTSQLVLHFPSRAEALAFETLEFPENIPPALQNRITEQQLRAALNTFIELFSVTYVGGHVIGPIRLHRLLNLATIVFLVLFLLMLVIYLALQMPPTLLLPLQVSLVLIPLSIITGAISWRTKRTRDMLLMNVSLGSFIANARKLASTLSSKWDVNFSIQITLDSKLADTVLPERAQRHGLQWSPAPELGIALLVSCEEHWGQYSQAIERAGAQLWGSAPVALPAEARRVSTCSDILFMELCRTLGLFEEQTLFRRFRNQRQAELIGDMIIQKTLNNSLARFREAVPVIMV